MDDKELLELAAKAAGIDAPYDEKWGGMLLPVTVHEPDDGYEFWNPLTGDGDALRLAVKLRISIDYALLPVELVLFVNACAEHIEPNISHEYLMVATRRAIVRAAAEIARQEKDHGTA